MLELERVVGIEPTTSAWKAEVLPLNYTHISRDYFAALYHNPQYHDKFIKGLGTYLPMAGVVGIEPALSESKSDVLPLN